MSLSQSDATNEPRSWSTGPLKQQIIDISVGSADTSAAVVCDRLSTVSWASVTSLVQTAAPTFSGNTVTLAFVAPGQTTFAQVTALGK